MSRVGITTHVLDTFRKMQEGQFEAALIPACIAVAATAEKEYPNVRTDNEKFKNYIRSNVRIIGFTAFNINAAVFNLRIDHPRLQRKINPETGAVPLEEIIYHAIRCGLLHEGQLHDSLEISQYPNTVFSVNEGKLVIGQNLPFGLILSVVLSPKYSGINAGQDININLRGSNILLSELWGKREAFKVQYIGPDN